MSLYLKEDISPYESDHSEVSSLSENSDNKSDEEYRH
jgi:hypothetical protein